MRQYMLLKVNGGGLNHFIINWLRPLMRKEAANDTIDDGTEKDG